MGRLNLNEYKEYKYKVKFSKSLSEEIKNIKASNQENIEGYIQWKDYLKWVCKHISPTSVAWDNHGVYQIRDNVIYKREPYMEVDYEIVTDNEKTCVCILNLDLKAEEYGLDVPSMFDEVDTVSPRFYIPVNITGDYIATPTKSNGYGADYVSEIRCHRKIFITESDLRGMVQETLKRILD